MSRWLTRAWWPVVNRPVAALIHGDLWSGNAARLPDGTLVIHGPALHYADRECDLAMAALFGGAYLSDARHRLHNLTG